MVRFRLLCGDFLSFVIFLLIFGKMALFWPFSSATYWGDFFEVDIYDNFITKSHQWVPNGPSRCLPSESVFFQEWFDFGYARRCKWPTSVGGSINQWYFNSAVASAIFSKNFLTNFFFGLLFGLSRRLVYRGIIFRKLNFRGFSTKLCSLKTE